MRYLLMPMLPQIVSYHNHQDLKIVSIWLRRLNDNDDTLDLQLRQQIQEENKMNIDT